MATREINVERFSITSSKPFDEVIEASTQQSAVPTSKHLERRSRRQSPLPT